MELIDHVMAAASRAASVVGFSRPAGRVCHDVVAAKFVIWGNDSFHILP